MRPENPPTGPQRRPPLRSAAGYLLMILFTLGIFLLIRTFGQGLVAPSAPAFEPAASAQGTDIFLRVLLALTAILVSGQVLARVFVRLGQPPVIGEVVAGILLGPSLLGSQLSGLILPASIAPTLGVIAQLGVVLYMFMVGLELDLSALRQRARATVAIAHAGILVPFFLGALLALWLYGLLSNSAVSFTNFAMFLGVAMSITAFPVLARILSDYQLSSTRLGLLALGCAAVADVTAWCLLAFVVGIVKAQAGAGLLVALGALGYIAVMLLLVRPLVARLMPRWQAQPGSRPLTVLVFAALLLSALAAEAIGIHAIFGAFLLGAIIPHDSAMARSLTHQLENVVTILLLPAFFAFTGMRTQIGLLTGPREWLLCGLIILVAGLGKFGATLLASRLTGLGWRSSAMLAALMNTRGLMELIVLNVGLDLKIISPTLFAMMVLMALVTTALTAPILRWLKTRPAPSGEVDLLTEG